MPHVCIHGRSANDGRFEGQWNAPFSQCSCCGVRFPYIDSGSYGANGGRGRTWQPKDKCSSCGGEYVEWEFKR
jgi:hypothetical protein